MFTWHAFFDWSAQNTDYREMGLSGWALFIRQYAQNKENSFRARNSQGKMCCQL